jgi:hypothetical protein
VNHKILLRKLCIRQHKSYKIIYVISCAPEGCAVRCSTIDNRHLTFNRHWFGNHVCTSICKKKKSNTNNIDKKWTPYNINESQEKHFCLNPPHVCVYPKPGHGLLKPHVVVFFALSDFRREVVVLFVDIGGIVSTFCYNYTKKKRNRSEQIHKAWSLQPSTRTETCLNSFTKAWAYQTPAKKKPV